MCAQSALPNLYIQRACAKTAPFQQNLSNASAHPQASIQLMLHNIKSCCYVLASTKQPSHYTVLLYSDNARGWSPPKPTSQSNVRERPAVIVWAQLEILHTICSQTVISHARFAIADEYSPLQSVAISSQSLVMHAYSVEPITISSGSRNRRCSKIAQTSATQ